MCIIFGSILYRIGGEQSMDVHRTDGKFHFSPCVIIAMLEDTLTRGHRLVRIVTHRHICLATILKYRYL